MEFFLPRQNNLQFFWSPSTWGRCRIRKPTFSYSTTLDYSGVNIRQFPGPAPWLTLASFCSRQPCAHRALSSSVGQRSPFQLLSSGIFVKIMIRPNLSKTKCIFEENVLHQLGHFLMSFGSLGQRCFALATELAQDLRDLLPRSPVENALYTS